MKSLLLALGILGVSTSALAADNKMLILGVGGDSCSYLNSGFEKDAQFDSLETRLLRRIAKAESIAWMQGYVSAATGGNKVLRKKLTSDAARMALFERLLAECAKDPEQKIAEAVAKAMAK